MRADELESLAGRVIVAGFPEASPPPRLAEALRHRALAGVVLFSRNARTPAAARALVEGLPSPPEGLIVAIDQEGGRVARLGAPMPKVPAAALLGRGTPEATRRIAETQGRALRGAGISLNLAPVFDVHTHDANPVIGDRAFGCTPAHVVRHGRAFAAGLAAAGVDACAKHFPGHGDTSLDSHVALPRVRHDRGRLDAIELAAFRGALALPAWMSAHVVYDALDPGVPATLSRVVLTELARGRLGFAGAMLSDDLEMAAVRDAHGVVGAGVAALEAGCDLLLVCSEPDEALALRSALASRAGASTAFQQRLREAEGRASRLRRVHPSRLPALSRRG